MMMRTVTVVRQYLAAAFFLVIGLTAYGCGDSATVNPVVELASLTVSPGSLQPGFSRETTQYRVDLTSDVSSVTVTAQPAVSGDTVTINGQATTSRTMTLEPAGETTVVNIVVSETDTNSRTYVIRLVRASLAGNNSLQNLTVSPGTLAPTFDPNLQAYTVSVANTVGSVTVTPTLSDPAATMTVNGQAALSGQGRVITLNGGGQNTAITIAVTAQNGTVKNYQVTVSRGRSNNNNLQSLGISPGTLSPAFRAGTTGYTVNLPATLASNVTSIRVTPTLQDTTATMTVNGQATTSGQARTAPLPAPGSNSFVNIVVVAQDGTSKTYSVNFIRAALGGNNNLRSLTVSQGTLAPAFSANTTAYTVDVGSGVSSISVTPTLSDPAATMTVNGQAATSGQARTITLREAGLSTVINIAVTAPNGTLRTYSVTVDRAALGGNNNLSALSVSPAGSLNPTFSANTTRYTANVDSAVTSVTVRATKADANAVMSDDVTAGAGTATGQATIQLGGPGTTTVVTIVVAAPNGSQKSYRIDIFRELPSSNNNLSALSVRVGTVVQTLSPTFTPGTTAYTANVATEVTEVIVRATKSDANATMAIGSVTVAPGTATGQAPITLNGAGTATTVSISVTAENGTVKNPPYTITVNRAAPAAPPAPATAPDLIPEDDSCSPGIPPAECAPGTSRSDNVTNVTTPRFSIAQPGAGQTASLYVNGVKVESQFDSGANTLRPVAALIDGNHTITYTMTNAGGESSPSPSLTVTIDTTPPATQ